MHLSYKWRDEHRAKIEAAGLTAEAKRQTDARADVSFKAEIMHFLGEVEVIFGIWVIPLLAAITLFKGWPAAEGYISHGVIFTEADVCRGRDVHRGDAAGPALCRANASA